MPQREDVPRTRDERTSQMRVSRRGMLAGIAAAGAVGAAGALAAVPAAAAATVPADAPDDLVAHVRDPHAGLIDLYVGDRHVELHDRALAAHLVHAAR
jgi:nitrous oxide reductase